MIPYDDLVAALSAWRARQGLPVSTVGGGSAAAPQPGSGPTAMPGSGPYGQPGSGPSRGAPPSPPGGKAPPPLAAPDDGLHEVDETEMIDEQYESEGADFAMQFGGNGDDQTAIGDDAGRPTVTNFNRDRGGRDDW